MLTTAGPQQQQNATQQHECFKRKEHRAEGMLTLTAGPQQLTAEKPIASINSKNNTDDTTAGPQQHQKR
jgi:hypothetical protein